MIFCLGVNIFKRAGIYSVTCTKKKIQGILAGHLQIPVVVQNIMHLQTLTDEYIQFEMSHFRHVLAFLFISRCDPFSAGCFISRSVGLPCTYSSGAPCTDVTQLYAPGFRSCNIFQNPRRSTHGFVPQKQPQNSDRLVLTIVPANSPNSSL